MNIDYICVMPMDELGGTFVGDAQYFTEFDEICLWAECVAHEGGVSGFRIVVYPVDGEPIQRTLQTSPKSKRDPLGPGFRQSLLKFESRIQEVSV